MRTAEKMINNNVLLINPFLTVYPDDPAGINPALGLGYLAAFLQEKKIEVSVLDIAAEGRNCVRKVGKKLRYGLTEEQIISRVREINPFLVGITCQSTLHAKDAHETARIIKRANKKILIVMGGAHPSSLPKEVLKDENVDIVVRGEGEITLWEIVRNFKNGKNLNDIEGISLRRNGKIIDNPPRSYITNLDTLPFPARDLLPMNIYFEEAQKNKSYSINNRVMTMITSRGCPGKCIYCAVRTVWGRYWRGRSSINVVDEIASLVNNFGANEIHFIDDSISVDRKRLENICDEIIKRGIKIKWTTPNGIAVWLLDEQLIVKMKKSGCYRLTFGLESGNKEVLNKFIGKHYDFNKAREIIKFSSSLGLWTIGTFILGFPYETLEQIKDTLDFAKSTDLDFAVFYIANPFPGTPMYDVYLKEKLLPNGEAYEVVRGCRTVNFSHEALTNIQAKATSEFLKSRIFKPKIFFNKLTSIENIKYLFRLGKSFLSMSKSPSNVKKKGIASFWK